MRGLHDANGMHEARPHRPVSGLGFLGFHQVPVNRSGGIRSGMKLNLKNSTPCKSEVLESVLHAPSRLSDSLANRGFWVPEP